MFMLVSEHVGTSILVPSSATGLLVQSLLWIKSSAKRRGLRSVHSPDAAYEILNQKKAYRQGCLRIKKVPNLNISPHSSL